MILERMTKTFEAVYENGVLRPVNELSLPDRSRVTVTISDAAPFESEASAYFSAEEWEAALRDEISLAEVRQALSSIDGSLSDAIVALREER
jgi:predicted DNA-binding antitoxin AbrB/MazE fold protein